MFPLLEVCQEVIGVGGGSKRGKGWCYQRLRGEGGWALIALDISGERPWWDLSQVWGQRFEQMWGTQVRNIQESLTSLTWKWLKIKFVHQSVDFWSDRIFLQGGAPPASQLNSYVTALEAFKRTSDVIPSLQWGRWDVDCWMMAKMRGVIFNSASLNHWFGSVKTKLRISIWYLPILGSMGNDRWWAMVAKEYLANPFVPTSFPRLNHQKS